MNRASLTVALLVAAACPPPATAQVQAISPPAPAAGADPPQPQPETYKLAVTPAPAPSPALRYSLTPEYLDLQPGNSVPFYYRAVLATKTGDPDRWKPFHDNQTYDVWFGPLDGFPKDEVKTFLAQFQPVFDQVEVAANREETDWDWNLKQLQGPETVQFLMEEIQESRTVARLLFLRARVEILEGRFEDAIRTLRIGYRLGRDVARPPTLINGLVGIAIASHMNRALIDLVNAPDSPNLYWALAGLPSPLVDLRPAMQHELSIPLRIFPFLRDAETARRTEEEWNLLPARMLEELQSLMGGAGQAEQPASRWQSRVAAAGMMLKGYPMARQALLDAGYDEERLDKMPSGQVVMIHQARVYHHMHDELLKWVALPPHEAYPRMRATEEQLKKEGYLNPVSRHEIIPVGALLMPAVSAATEAYMRLLIRMDSLRAVEAIRMHAAAHGGALPKSLDEITLVPVPSNPATGRPFAYRLDGDTATLDVPTASGQPVQHNWRFEITIARPAAEASSGDK